MENIQSPPQLSPSNSLYQESNQSSQSQAQFTQQQQLQMQQYQQQLLLSQLTQQQQQQYQSFNGIDISKIVSQVQLQQELQNIQQQMCLNYMMSPTMQGLNHSPPQSPSHNNNNTFQIQQQPVLSPLNYLLSQNNMLNYGQSTLQMNQTLEDSVKEEQSTSLNTQGSPLRSLKRKNKNSLDQSENIPTFKKVQKNPNNNNFMQTKFNKNISFQGSDWVQNYISNNQIIQEYFFEAQQQQIQKQDIVKITENFMELIDKNNTTEEINLLTDQEHKKNIFVFKPQNMPHLLMNKILRQFTMNNLEKINLPVKLRNKLGDIFRECKTYLHLKENKEDTQHIRKLYVYNHSHFNLLFLSLNQISIKKMLNLKNQMDVEMHETIFGVDFNEITEEQIQFINFLKKCFYELTLKYVTNNEMEKSGEQFYQYQKKAFESMQLLSNGQLILRF